MGSSFVMINDRILSNHVQSFNLLLDGDSTCIKNLIACTTVILFYESRRDWSLVLGLAAHFGTPTSWKFLSYNYTCVPRNYLADLYSY